MAQSLIVTDDSHRSIEMSFTQLLICVSIYLDGGKVFQSTTIE